MSPVEVYSKSKGQLLAEDLYRSFEARLSVSTLTACPVEFASAFVRTAASESCGKCTPCRVGLAQLARLIDAVLDGKASDQTLDLIAELAQGVFASADCAIGFEAGAFALRSLKGFRDDFLYHVQHNDCSMQTFAPVPCVAGCPAGIDIPGYNALVAAGRYTDAVKLIRRDNPFVSACGLVCEHPCELYCRRGMVDDPLNIRGIKRFATEHQEEDYEPLKAEPTGKQVAVIGGGPSGLSAAYYLALMGHSPVVYEQRRQLGGMLRYGIPAYRVPREELD
ncbi:MAG: NAD(P)-binding protein, partial [Coriobacteriales bacterium]|nr:NAD(P)-binding protein [Coriobacteriales bacterium]